MSFADLKRFPKANMVIVEYFEEMINRIDIEAETILLNEQTEETVREQMNRLRDQFLKEIQSIKEHNLTAYDKNQIRLNRTLAQLEESSQVNAYFSELMPHFCFHLSKQSLNGKHLIGVLVIADSYWSVESRNAIIK